VFTDTSVASLPIDPDSEAQWRVWGVRKLRLAIYRVFQIEAWYIPVYTGYGIYQRYIPRYLDPGPGLGSSQSKKLILHPKDMLPTWPAWACVTGKHLGSGLLQASLNYHTSTVVKFYWSNFTGQKT
jgi:hypothetical protein